MKYVNAKAVLPHGLVEVLQDKYCLSVHAIRKIIYQK